MPSNKGTKWETRNALGMEDSYKIYKKSTEKPVDRSTYGKVIKEGNKILARMLVEGKTVRIPYLSHMKVVKTSTGNPNMDFQHFNKTGERRLLTNEHSDGFKARLHWSKKNCKVEGRLPYSLKLNKAFSSMISSSMKEEGGHRKYGEILYNNYGG